MNALPILLGVLIGWIIGTLIYQTYTEYFSRTYLCHNCENEAAKMTRHEYLQFGGAHEVCPPKDIGIL